MSYSGKQGVTDPEVTYRTIVVHSFLISGPPARDAWATRALGTRSTPGLPQQVDASDADSTHPCIICTGHDPPSSPASGIAARACNANGCVAIRYASSALRTLLLALSTMKFNKMLCMGVSKQGVKDSHELTSSGMPENWTVKTTLLSRQENAMCLKQVELVVAADS